MKYLEPTEQEIRKAEKLANKRLKKVERLIDINLSMPIYLREMVDQKSQVYGKGIENKVIYDSQGILHHGGKNEADSYYFNVLIGRKESVEIKSSISSKKGVHRITHIRNEQDFDYFFICLVDKYDNCKERFFLLQKQYITDNFKLTAMNGTTKANKNNKVVSMSMTIRKEVAYDVFGQNNVLNGTSYRDWVNYLNKVSNLPKTTSNAIVNPIRKMYANYCFKVNGRIIRGSDNADTIVKLANYIGGYMAMAYFPKNRISKTPTKTCKIKLQVGEYYVDPKFEIREVLYTLDMSTKFDGLRIEMA